MVPFLLPLLIWVTPCPYCFGFYTLGGISRHVKNAHPPNSLVSQAYHVVLSLRVSSLHVFFPDFIFVIYWGGFQTGFNSILGLFECYFVCFCLFHRIL